MVTDVVLEEADYVDGYQVGAMLEYVRKWPPDKWPLAFFGMLHIIPQRDFNYIEDELKRAEGSLELSDVAEAEATESHIVGLQITEPLSEESLSELPVPSGSLLVAKTRSKVAGKSRKSSHRRRMKKHR